MPGSARGDGDASDDLAVPDAVQPAALLRSCEAHFLSQEELNDGFEFFSENLRCLLPKRMGMVSGDGKGQGLAQRNCDRLIRESEL